MATHHEPDAHGRGSLEADYVAIDPKNEVFVDKELILECSVRILSDARAAADAVADLEPLTVRADLDDDPRCIAAEDGRPGRDQHASPEEYLTVRRIFVSAVSIISSLGTQGQ